MGATGLSQAEAGPEIILQITPEPTADERDALVVALAVLLTEPGAAIAVVQPQTTARWARAGRDAAIAARRIRRGWRDG